MTALDSSAESAIMNVSKDTFYYIHYGGNTMTDLIVIETPATPAMPIQAHNDDTLIGLWLHGKAESSKRIYTLDVDRFIKAVNKPLNTITLGDLQQFSDTLTALKPATQARIISVIKSLMTFGQKIGYIQFNVGAAISAPKVKNTLAERIMTEEQVMSMLALETSKRNHLILRLLYNAGLRVSELCDLQWKDVKPNRNTGQITVFGKGSKTRVVKLSQATYQELCSLRNESPDNDYVFCSRKGHSRLTSVQVFRIVRDAAKRIGLNSVSPHWLRHAHASHSLDRGATIALVKETLGHEDIKTTGKYLHAKPDSSSAEYLPV